MMFDCASNWAAHSAAPTVFVNVKMSPMTGTKENNNAPTPNLLSTISMLFRGGVSPAQHVRSIFRSMLLHKCSPLCTAEAFELEVSRMPTRSGAMSINAQKSDGTEDRHKIHWEGNEIAKDTVARQSLDGPQKRISSILGAENFVFPSLTSWFCPCAFMVASKTNCRVGSRKRGFAKKLRRKIDSAPSRKRAKIGPRKPVIIDNKAAWGTYVKKARMPKTMAEVPSDFASAPRTENII